MVRKAISFFLVAVLVLGLSAPVQAASGYAVSLTPAVQTAASGDTAYIRVSISGPSAYNAGDFSFKYDTELLEFDEASSTIPQTYAAEVQDGSLRIKFIGAEKSLNAVFRLAFLVKATGEARVRLTSARVDAQKNALHDAPEANITNAQAIINCIAPQYSVTLPDWFSGSENASDGADYDFTALDRNYDYTFNGTTMNGEAVEVGDDGTGGFQIQSVTGDIVVVSQRTPKKYSVSITGSARDDIQAATGTGAAEYLKDYTFSVNKDAQYSYDAPEIYVGNSKFTGYTVSGNSYTIPGVSVTGSIIIRVNRNILDPENTTSVSFSGSAAGDLQGEAYAALNQNYSFTLDQKAGYEYTLSATMNGKNVNAVKQNDGSYLILNVTGPLVITADKTALVSVAVDEYVKLDNGLSAYLITVTGPMDGGQTYTYDSNVMFYSAKYNACAWLVISKEPLSVFSREVPGKVGLASAQSTGITYTGDVNSSGLTDINDAQLVWNMYNAHYDGFTLNSMERFLRADMNGSRTLNVQDAVAIASIA